MHQLSMSTGMEEINFGEMGIFKTRIKNHSKNTIYLTGDLLTGNKSKEFTLKVEWRNGRFEMTDFKQGTIDAFVKEGGKGK